MADSLKNKIAPIMMGALISAVLTGGGAFMVLGANNATKAFVEKEIGGLEEVVKSNNDVINKLNELIARHDERIKHLEDD